MNKFGLVIALLLLVITSRAQIANNAGGSNTTGGGSGDTPHDTITYGGKVPVPESKKRAIVVSKVTTPITIDGRLDEEAWKTAAVFKDFYNANPGYNTEPSKPTEAYMMYDEHNLLLVFK